MTAVNCGANDATLIEDVPDGEVRSGFHTFHRGERLLKSVLRILLGAGGRFSFCSCEAITAFSTIANGKYSLMPFTVLSNARLSDGSSVTTRASNENDRDSHRFDLSRSASG